MAGSKIREERIKLAASVFNIAAAGAFTNAVFVTTLGFAAHPNVPTDAFTLAGAILICLGGAAILHLIAQFLLGYL